MKKFVSFIMVAFMLTSLLALGVSAEQTNMEVTVPKFAAQPTFDGVVSAEEWGEATVHMVTEGAATADDNEIGVNEEFGLRNIFYWFAVEGLSDTLSYDLWIRWDDAYLYVAAVVNDPDPFSLPKGGEEIWNGDMVQIRVDEKGPSAMMLASTPEFNYKTDAFNGARFKKPWSSDKEVFNGIMGLVKGEDPTFWRCGKNYGDGWNLKNDGALVGISYVETENEGCTTTYEGAIPWAAVNATLVPKAGDVYGMCVSVACSDSNELNAWLQWGHGVTSVDENVQPRGTRGGSQAIVLADEAVTPAAGYATAGAETTEPADETPDKEPAKTEADGTKAPVNNEETKETTTKRQPTNTAPVIDNGPSTGVIIGIVAAVLVVVAVVAVIIVKKKN